MTDTTKNEYIGRSPTRLRLYVGQERESADGADAGEMTDYQQLEGLLSSITGNIRMLRLELPDVPDAASRRIDDIAEAIRRITTLINRQDRDTIPDDDTGSGITP